MTFLLLVEAYVTGYRKRLQRGTLPPPADAVKDDLVRYARAR
jgi:hypothetical protein